jgi:hypothetical protein
MMMFMGVIFAHTGRGIDLSTTRLAVIAAAGLAKDNAPPQVSGQFGDFLRPGHLLVHVG